MYNTYNTSPTRAAIVCVTLLMHSYRSAMSIFNGKQDNLSVT